MITRTPFSSISIQLDASTTKYLLMTQSVAIALQHEHAGTDNFHYWCSQVRSDQEMPVLQSSSKPATIGTVCRVYVFTSVNRLSSKDGLMEQAEADGSGKKRKKKHRFLG
jgi:hypothetical protein